WFPRGKSAAIIGQILALEMELQNAHVEDGVPVASPEAREADHVKIRFADVGPMQFRELAVAFSEGRNKNLSFSRQSECPSQAAIACRIFLVSLGTTPAFSVRSHVIEHEKGLALGLKAACQGDPFLIAILEMHVYPSTDALAGL